MKTVYKIENGKMKTKEFKKGRTRGWFYTEEEAINHYNECVRKFNDFKMDLVELLTKHKAHINVEVGDGFDTHGLYGDKIVASMVIGEVEVDCELTNSWYLGHYDIEKEEEYQLENSSPKI